MGSFGRDNNGSDDERRGSAIENAESVFVTASEIAGEIENILRGQDNLKLTEPLKIKIADGVMQVSAKVKKWVNFGLDITIQNAWPSIAVQNFKVSTSWLEERIIKEIETRLPDLPGTLTGYLEKKYGKKIASIALEGAVLRINFKAETKPVTPPQPKIPKEETGSPLVEMEAKPEIVAPKDVEVEIEIEDEIERMGETGEAVAKETVDTLEGYERMLEARHAGEEPVKRIEALKDRVEEKRKGWLQRRREAKDLRKAAEMFNPAIRFFLAGETEKSVQHLETVGVTKETLLVAGVADYIKDCLGDEEAYEAFVALIKKPNVSRETLARRALNALSKTKDVAAGAAAKAGEVAGRAADLTGRAVDKARDMIVGTDTSAAQEHEREMRNSIARAAGLFNSGHAEAARYFLEAQGITNIRKVVGETPGAGKQLADTLGILYDDFLKLFDPPPTEPVATPRAEKKKAAKAAAPTEGGRAAGGGEGGGGHGHGSKDGAGGHGGHGHGPRDRYKTVDWKKVKADLEEQAEREATARREHFRATAKPLPDRVPHEHFSTKVIDAVATAGFHALQLLPRGKDAIVEPFKVKTDYEKSVIEQQIEELKEKKKKQPLTKHELHELEKLERKLNEAPLNREDKRRLDAVVSAFHEHQDDAAAFKAAVLELVEAEEQENIEPKKYTAEKLSEWYGYPSFRYLHRKIGEEQWRAFMAQLPTETDYQYAERNKIKKAVVAWAQAKGIPLAKAEEKFNINMYIKERVEKGKDRAEIIEKLQDKIKKAAEKKKKKEEEIVELEVEPEERAPTPEAEPESKEEQVMELEAEEESEEKKNERALEFLRANAGPLREALLSDDPAENTIQALRAMDAATQAQLLPLLRQALANEARLRAYFLEQAPDISIDTIRYRLELFLEKAASEFPATRKALMEHSTVPESDFDLDIEEAPPEFASQKEVEKFEPFVKEVSFNDNYQGRPEEIPEAERELHLKTPLGEIHGRSDCGGAGSKYKEENQDAMLAGVSSGKKLFALVVDGAGGSHDPLFAVRDVLAQASADLSADVDVHEILSKEYERLIELQKGKKGEEKSYACAVALQLDENGKVMLVWSGDSRAVTVRRDAVLLEGSTTMQNEVAKLIKQGLVPPENYYTHPFNHLIKGALGLRKEKPEFITFQAEDKDQIILASDGLWDVVSEFEVVELSEKYRGSELQREIFKLAHKRNNSTKPFTIVHAPGVEVEMQPKFDHGDNITVVVVDVNFAKKGAVLKKPAETSKAAPPAEPEPTAPPRPTEIAEKTATEKEKELDEIIFKHLVPSDILPKEAAQRRFEIVRKYNFSREDAKLLQAMLAIDPDLVHQRVQEMRRDLLTILEVLGQKADEERTRSASGIYSNLARDYRFYTLFYPKDTPKKQLADFFENKERITDGTIGSKVERAYKKEGVTALAALRADHPTYAEIVQLLHDEKDRFFNLSKIGRLVRENLQTKTAPTATGERPMTTSEEESVETTQIEEEAPLLPLEKTPPSSGGGGAGGEKSRSGETARETLGGNEQKVFNSLIEQFNNSGSAEEFVKNLEKAILNMGWAERTLYVPRLIQEVRDRDDTTLRYVTARLGAGRAVETLMAYLQVFETEMEKRRVKDTLPGEMGQMDKAIDLFGTVDTEEFQTKLLLEIGARGLSRNRFQIHADDPNVKRYFELVGWDENRIKKFVAELPTAEHYEEANNVYYAVIKEPPRREHQELAKKFARYVVTNHQPAALEEIQAYLATNHKKIAAEIGKLVARKAGLDYTALVAEAKEKEKEAQTRKAMSPVDSAPVSSFRPSADEQKEKKHGAVGEFKKIEFGIPGQDRGWVAGTFDTGSGKWKLGDAFADLTVAGLGIPKIERGKGKEETDYVFDYGTPNYRLVLRQNRKTQEVAMIATVRGVTKSNPVSNPEDLIPLLEKFKSGAEAALEKAKAEATKERAPTNTSLQTKFDELMEAVENIEEADLMDDEKLTEIVDTINAALKQAHAITSSKREWTAAVQEAEKSLDELTTHLKKKYKIKLKK